MVHARADTDGLTLLYRANEQFIVGSIVAAFALAFGFGAFVTLQEPIDSTIILIAATLGLIASALGLYALSCFHSGWQRIRHPKWLLRFTPKAVQVNPLHPGYGRVARGLPEQQLTIPLSEVEWIRKTIKPAFWTDDQDEIYIEMRVSDSAFQSASALKAVLRKSLEDVSAVDTETILQQFEGNVIRVLVEGTRWPKEISSYWRAHPYKIAPPFTIERPVDITAAKAQPRELL